MKGPHRRKPEPFDKQPYHFRDMMIPALRRRLFAKLSREGARSKRRVGDDILLHGNIDLENGFVVAAQAAKAFPEAARTR